MRDCEKKYREYLESHISNVENAYKLLLSRINEMGLSNQELLLLENNIKNHDKSKFTKEEFLPYSNYFYGDKTEKTIIEFRNAVLVHKKKKSASCRILVGAGKRYADDLPDRDGV